MGSVSNWPVYRSIKVVKAKAIAEVKDDLIVFHDGTTMAPVENMFVRYRPVPGDYVIAYDDGYLSISPAQQFATGYVKA